MDQDFNIYIRYNSSINASFENMFTLITDPAMLIYSGVDRKSHQRNQIFRIKEGYRAFYEVKVDLKDSDTPAERESCFTFYMKTVLIKKLLIRSQR